MSNKSLGRILTLVITTICVAAPTISIGPVLEEVVVTARKRAESLQDVPISVQAISGERISVQGIVDIQQLAPYTPTVVDS